MQKLSKQLYYTQWQKGEENVHHIQIVDQNKHCHFFRRYDVDSLLWLSNIIANHRRQSRLSLNSIFWFFRQQKEQFFSLNR